MFIQSTYLLYPRGLSLSHRKQAVLDSSSEQSPESRTAATSPNQQFLANFRCRIVHPNAQNRPNAIFLIQIDPTTPPRVHGHFQPDRLPTFVLLSHCEERPQQCHPRLASARVAALLP